jgi:hypothetical protein
MILFGLVIGRWWAVPLGAVVWPALLLATGISGDIALAAALGAANAAVGVAPRVAISGLRRARPTA